MNGHDFKASWINTIGDQGKLPYMRTPALLECCLSDRSHPASFFKLDLFHVCCAGILKDFVGSCLTVLLELFDEPNLPERAAKMNEVLKTFCKNQRHTFHANQLNLSLLGYSVKDYVSGSWSKGQDSIVLLRFVVWLCGKYPANDIEQHDQSGCRGFLQILGFAARIWGLDLWSGRHGLCGQWPSLLHSIPKAGCVGV